MILNGRVIDPESKLDAIRHVGIRGNRIATVSEAELRGKKVVNARDLVVAPGFIDPISHGQDIENDRLQTLNGLIDEEPRQQPRRGCRALRTKRHGTPLRRGSESPTMALDTPMARHGLPCLARRKHRKPAW